MLIAYTIIIPDAFGRSFRLQETRSIKITPDSPISDLTTELHKIRAHHLHYSILLSDLEKHIVFIRDTRNPTMDDMEQEDRDNSKETMDRECQNLLTEGERLRSELSMQELRLKNALTLVCSVVGSLLMVT